MISNQITFGVASMGRMEPLLVCISSVLNGERLPEKISIAFVGEFPAFDNFYLAQIAALARFKGVGFSISYLGRTEVRDARDWLLENCFTEFLWMGDEDVFYDRRALHHFELATADQDHAAFYVGSKIDVNNRRGYPDFDLQIHTGDEVVPGCSFNHFYETDFKTVKVRTLDTGHVLINAVTARRFRWKFRLFADSLNCGGEDTLFALQIAKQGKEGFFVPTSRAYHLEKESSNFGEFAARGEMLLRACDFLDYDKDIVKNEFMPFLFPKTKGGE